MSQPVLFDSSRESTPSSVIDDLLTKISDDIDISDDLRTKRILERVSFIQLLQSQILFNFKFSFKAFTT